MQDPAVSSEIYFIAGVSPFDRSPRTTANPKRRSQTSIAFGMFSAFHSGVAGATIDDFALCVGLILVHRLGLRVYGLESGVADFG